MITSLRSIFSRPAVALFLALSPAVWAQERSSPPANTPVPPPPPDAAAPAPAVLRLAEEPVPSRSNTGKSRRESAHERALERAAERRASRTDHALINVFGDSTLPKGENSDAVVSIFGSSTADGDVVDAVVSVFGDTRVGGTVGEAAVAVFGNAFVNGHVRGDVVVVFGDIEFGPEAEVDGKVVCVAGTVKRDPQATLGHGVQKIGIGVSPTFRVKVKTWIKECLLLGRPLAVGPDLGWAWGIAGVFLGFCLLLALVFRGGIETCVQTLATRPGASAITALLTVFIVPVATILLILTGVGIFFVPLVGMALFFASLFGMAAVLAALGFKITRLFGEGSSGHPALAILIAGLIVLGLYTVPVFGFVILKVMGWLGLGVVILTVFQAMKRERPARVVKAPAANAAVAGPGGEPGAAATEPGGVPPIVAQLTAGPAAVSAATLPRAGFWIRFAALLLDVVILAIIALLLTGGGRLALFGIAAYAAVLWKLKGTTIGGVICGLKVVRLDERPIDWGTAIVRTLGCFLSLAVVGLGFIWVAIDDERQSWHDKIAGTTVVRVPPGASLV